VQKLGVLFIVRQDAEVLIGGAGRPGGRAASGRAQAVKEGWLWQRAWLFGHMPQCSFWRWAVGVGRSPFGVPKLSEGVVRAGHKRFCSYGTGRGRELTEVDEGCGAAGPGDIARLGCAAGATAAAASRRRSAHLPALKDSQRRSNSSGGTRVSPGARYSSMRGAKQKSFFFFFFFPTTHFVLSACGMNG